MQNLMHDSLLSKYVKIASVVTLYWVVSMTMVFVNKTLLGEATMGDKDAPLFVTFFQCVVTVVVCFLLSRSSVIFHFVKFPKVGLWESKKVKQILPLSLLFVAMIAMNNLCLKFVGVAFYYVGRSLTTVFNVIFTYIILGQKTSGYAVLCCAVIIGGFLLGVDQESVVGSLSVIGVTFGISASAAVSLNAIFTKKVLPAVDGSIWELAYYNNSLACIIFIPLILIFGEIKPVVRLVIESDLKFWILMFIGGICGSAIGYVTGLQIQVTSPLTHNISGTAKACAQTMIATWWYDDFKPFFWWLSNFIVLVGSASYTRVKQIELKKSHIACVHQPSKESGKYDV